MAVEPPDRFDRTVDVVVIGSGTGLVPALKAAVDGATVLLLEKSPKVGGTTAVSGGGIWIPFADVVVEAIGETPREKLVGYVERVSGGRADPDVIERFLDAGPELVEFLEESSGLSFIHSGLTDYHPDWEGGHPDGRMIEPAPFDASGLGEALSHVRESPQLSSLATYPEIIDAGGAAKFALNADDELLEERRANDVRARGEGLVAGLYEACLDHGVDVERDAPAESLVVDDGRVRGVLASIDGEAVTVGAGAVVVASGGMEWDEEMREGFLRGKVTAPASPPYNEGDGIRMGMALGAKLGNMNEAWWQPVAHVPGEEWEDGSPVYRLPNDRYLPGSILVNEDGERFVDEACNYNDLAKAFHEFDPVAYDYRNLPAYLVFDQGFRDHYAVMGEVMPGDETPEWLASADDLETLARELGVDPEGLQSTVRQFNEHAREGVDPEFHAGESTFDRKKGDGDADHPNLAPLEQPPFYAYRMYSGVTGTKGGLVTTVDGEVLDVNDEVIPGLYASSNATASMMGVGYVGGGATLGPNMVFGYLAGEAAARYALRE